LKADQFELTYIESPLSPFEQFLENMARNSATQGLVRSFAPALMFINQTQMGNRVSSDLLWLNRNSSKPINAVAHCFCAF
jgi:protease-4